MSLQQIRAVRAVVTWDGRDAKSRRDTFNAALAQFEELLRAAEAVGPASRPLPLFYAVSQAGRALAALAGGDRWRLKGHGIECIPDPKDLMESNIRTRRGSSDSFSGVAKVIGSECPVEAFPLGDVLGALEALKGLDFGAYRYPEPLRVVEHDRLSALNPGVQALVEFPQHVMADPSPWTAARRCMNDYPEFDGAVLARETPTPQFEKGWIAVDWHIDGPRRQDDWKGSQAAGVAHLDRIAPYGPRHDDTRWIQVPVGGRRIHPLMSWWAALHALSVVARYEPALWRGSLDIDASVNAVPLEVCLDWALTDMPDLVFAAIGTVWNAVHDNKS